MHVLYVIPARLGSTRLPNKPLRLLAGEPLIRRVAKRVQGMADGPVVVATDSRRVAGAVGGTGASVVLTQPGHVSGTDRVAEVIDRPEYAEFDLIVNVQGDEPFVPAEAVTGVIDRVIAGDDIGTAATLLMAQDAADPNRVKVAVDAGGRAISFSRSFIPGSHHHRGIYAYRRDALFAWVHAGPAPEEVAERLEQLRPLALGLTIGVAVLNDPAPAGIDTEEDLQMAEAYLTGVGV